MTEKLKVLIIGPSPERSKGGMATVIQEIRDDQILNRTFDISIYDSFIDGTKLKRAFYTVYALIKFQRVYQPFDLFHIHVASYGSTFRKAKYVEFLKKHNKKVILHIHGAAYMDFYFSLNEKRRAYIVNILNACDLVIALSDEWKHRFEENFGLKNCVAVPNGINTGMFQKAITRDEENTNTFLFLGRLGKRKGVYDLIKAVQLLLGENPDVKVYLAGDGEIAQVKECIAENKLENYIEVVGWVDNPGKLELMKKVATIILPSYNEGLPMAILEGMAAGKAIISTTVGAIPEVVKQENGILVEPGDVRSIADAMKTIMNNPELVCAMREANLTKVNAFYSMESMHQKLSKYYSEVGM